VPTKGRPRVRHWFTSAADYLDSADHQKLKVAKVKDKQAHKFPEIPGEHLRVATWKSTRPPEASISTKPRRKSTLEVPSPVHLHRRIPELASLEPPNTPQLKVADYYDDDQKCILDLIPDSPPAELYSPPGQPFESDYFAAGPKPRRRGATKNGSIQPVPGSEIISISLGMDSNADLKIIRDEGCRRDIVDVLLEQWTMPASRIVASQ
jgi:hypothetical protein